MILVKNVKMIHKTKGKIFVDIEVHQKLNSLFSVHIIRFEGRRITPFENKIRGLFEYTLEGLFKIVYGNTIKDLVSIDNVILRDVGKL